MCRRMRGSWEGTKGGLLMVKVSLGWALAGEQAVPRRWGEGSVLQVEGIL